MNTTLRPANPAQNYESPLTLEEGAKLLRRSVKTLRRLIQSGDFHAFKIGGRWFVRVSEIEAFIQRQIAKTGGNTPC
jgi:excisionase family DNA binding protein